MTIESMSDGIRIYRNPLGVLTNNPPFDYHLQNLCNYMNLSPMQPKNHFQQIPSVHHYSIGMGAIGLPGDLSSASRFIRAAFTLENSSKYESETKSVCQFFHILNTVSQTEGCVNTGNGLEKTIYSSCCNTDMGIYYYTTYFNPEINAVRLKTEELDRHDLIQYPLQCDTHIRFEN